MSSPVPSVSKFARLATLLAICVCSALQFRSLTALTSSGIGDADLDAAWAPDYMGAPRQRAERPKVEWNNAEKKNAEKAEAEKRKARRRAAEKNKQKKKQNNTNSTLSGHTKMRAVNHTFSAALQRDHLPQPKTEPRPVFIEESTLERIMIVPEYKLLFCWIDKVGGSMFQDIWQVLRILHPDVGKAEKQFQGAGRFFKNLPEHFGLNKSDLEDLHINPKWTKAVFYRDPATRFLSAFQSKCVRPMENRGRACKNMFESHVFRGKSTKARASEIRGKSHKAREKNYTLGNFSFDDALDIVEADPNILQYTNYHTMLQANSCGGLSNTLRYYDFVDQITESTSPHSIGKLLKNIGVDKIVSNGIIDCLVAREDCTYLKSLVPLYAPRFIFPKTKVTKDADKHNTGSNHGDTLLKNYKTNDRLQVIQTAYEADYKLFHYQQLNLEGLQLAGV